MTAAATLASLCTLSVEMCVTVDSANMLICMPLYMYSPVQDSYS